MPIFSIGVAVATAVGTFIGAAGAIGTFVLNAAVGIGMNLLAQQIAGKKSSPSTTGPGFSVQGTLNSGGDVPRSIIAGWRATAGSLVYANTWGEEDNGKTPNAYLTQVIALADYPVKDLVAIWVNGERRQIDWNDENYRGFVVKGYRKDDRNHLWVRFYDGTQTQADPLCVQKVSSAERPYEAGRVGVGIPYVVVTCRVNDELFSGFPTFKFEVDGASLYDPSKDSSVGGNGTQRWDQPATWGGDGDHFPLVQAYNVLRGISYAGQWLYGLQNMAAARLPVANWIAQINKCRAVVDGPDGDEPTYRSSAEIFVNNEFNETIKQLLTSCQGRISEIGGFYKAYCGAPDSPVFSFTDDDIISTQEQSFSPFFGLSDTVNGITAKYPEPAEGWNNKPAPPIYRTDLEAKVGNRRLPSDVSLDMVPYANQVQRLMKEAIQEAQRARRHTFVLPPRYWYVEPGDTGEWTSTRNGYEGKWFRVDGGVDRADLDVMLDLTEVDPADYDYNYATDFVPQTIGSTIIVRPAPQAIVDFGAFPNEISNGVVKRPGIVLSWNNEDLDDIEGIAFEVRVAATGTVIIRGRSDDPNAGSSQIEGNGLLPVTSYEVRARYIPASPRDVEWSGWIAVTTTDTRFNFADLDTGPADYLTNQLRLEIERLKASVQSVAGLIGAQDSQNWTDRVEDRRILQIVKGGLSATIEEVRTVAVGIGTSLAALTLTVNAAVADIGNVQSAVSQVQQQFTAFAGPGGTFANYQVSVASQFTTIGTDIDGLETGLSSITSAFDTFAGPGGTFATYQTSVSSQFSTLNDGLADIVQDFTTFAGPGGTFAQYQNSVTASLGGLNSSVTTVSDAVAGINGALAATWSVTTNVNNHVTGLKLYNSGTFGFFVLEVDYFQIAKTGTTGGAAKTLFEIGTVNGIAEIILKGNLFADGFIQVRHLTVDSINAITANITNLTAANINSAYAIYNGGGYNGSNYVFQRQQNISNSESRPQTPDGGIFFSKSFTTVSGRILIFCNLSAYSNDQQVRFGNGNWSPNGESFRINATLRVKNNVGTVIESISLGVSANSIAPTLTGSEQLFTQVPAGQTVTVEIIGGFQLAGSTNNSGQEVSYRWYYKVDAQKVGVVILEPYNMEAL